MKYKIDHPDYISIEGGKVIAGMILTDRDNNIGAEQKRKPERIEIANVAGYQHVDVRWIVSGGSRYTIRVESVKGGIAEAQSE